MKYIMFVGSACPTFCVTTRSRNRHFSFSGNIADIKLDGRNIRGKKSSMLSMMSRKQNIPALQSWNVLPFAGLVTMRGFLGSEGILDRADYAGNEAITRRKNHRRLRYILV